MDWPGILADDMGLGKTVQTLAHLLVEKEAGRLDRPALVVAPTSLMGNWRREAARFAPALRTLVLHGSDRHAHFDAIPDKDLVLTTYPLLPRDQARLQETIVPQPDPGRGPDRQEPQVPGGELSSGPSRPTTGSVSPGRPWRTTWASCGPCSTS